MGITIMELKELRTDTTILTWLENIEASKQTQKSYLQAMHQYTEYTKLCPEELLDEAENEAGLIPRKRKLKGYLIGFRESIRKNCSDYTVRARLAAVRSFYEANEINMPKLKGGSTPVQKEENIPIPTKQDLQDCLSKCDLIEKAIMLVGISGGLASNEIRNLKLAEFKKGYDPITKICTLPLRREKTKVDFITFLSPEATTAIWEYIEYRDRPLKAAGIKRRNQIEKQRTTEDSYLFIVRSVPKMYLSSRNEELRKMGENAILKIYNIISEKAQKDTKTGYNLIRSHTMRKFFNSCLLNNECDSFNVEFWMGHQIEKSKAAYFRADIESQKKIYMRYVPYLTLEKSIDVSVSPEFQNVVEENKTIKSENENLKSEVERVSIDRLEIQRAKAETDRKINELEEKMIVHDLQAKLRYYHERKRTAPVTEKSSYDKTIENIRQQIKKHGNK